MVVHMMTFLAEKYILEEVRTLRQCRESTREPETDC